MITHHAFLTDLTGTAVDVDQFHHHHAVVELAIKGLKKVPGSNTSHPATSQRTRRGRNAPVNPNETTMHARWGVRAQRGETFRKPYPHVLESRVRE